MNLLWLFVHLQRPDTMTFCQEEMIWSFAASESDFEHCIEIYKNVKNNHHCSIFFPVIIDLFKAEQHNITVAQKFKNAWIHYRYGFVSSVREMWLQRACY